MKPHSAALRHRQLGERELELGADAGEVVEPCAADLGAALGVDGAEQLAELEVVARLEALGREVARRADGVEHDEVVLAALGRLVRRGVGQRLQQRHRTPRRPRPGRPRPALTCALSSLVWASSACFSSPCGLAGSACRRSSARPAPPRTPRWTTGGARRPRQVVDHARWARRGALGGAQRRRGRRAGVGDRSRRQPIGRGTTGPTAGIIAIPYAGSTLPPTGRVSRCRSTCAVPSPPRRRPVTGGRSPSRPSCSSSSRSSSAPRPRRCRTSTTAVASWAYDSRPRPRRRSSSFLDVVAIVSSNWSVRRSCSRSSRRTPRGAASAVVAGWIVLSGVVVIGGNALIKLAFQRERPVVGRAAARDRRVLVPERPRRRRRAVLHRR